MQNAKLGNTFNLAFCISNLAFSQLLFVTSGLQEM